MNEGHSYITMYCLRHEQVPMYGTYQRLSVVIKMLDEENGQNNVTNYLYKIMYYSTYLTAILNCTF